MLQTLLADRFKLKLHRETRELPIYDLTVAKSGSKCRNRQACCPFLGIGTNTYSTCNSTTLWPSRARLRASFSSSVHHQCFRAPTNTVESGFSTWQKPSVRPRAST